MSPLLAIPLFLCSLGVTLAAARVFARRLDRLGIRFGFPEALVGLLTALAADGPEIASALVALAKGAHSVSVGVLVGSNVFNLAAMIGLSALLAGAVRLPRDVLLLEGLIGAPVTLTVAAVLLGWLAPLAALILMTCVLGPYLLLLIHGPCLAFPSTRVRSGHQVIPAQVESSQTPANLTMFPGSTQPLSHTVPRLMSIPRRATKPSFPP